MTDMFNNWNLEQPEQTVSDTESDNSETANGKGYTCLHCSKTFQTCYKMRCHRIGLYEEEKIQVCSL